MKKEKIQKQAPKDKKSNKEKDARKFALEAELAQMEQI